MCRDRSLLALAAAPLIVATNCELPTIIKMDNTVINDYWSLIDLESTTYHLTLGQVYCEEPVCSHIIWMYSPSAQIYYDLVAEERGTAAALTLAQFVCQQLAALSRERLVHDSADPNQHARRCEVKLFERCCLGDYEGACQLFQKERVLGTFNNKSFADQAGVFSTSTLAAMVERNWCGLLLCVLRRSRLAEASCHDSSDVCLWFDPEAEPAAWIVYRTIWPRDNSPSNRIWFRQSADRTPIPTDVTLEYLVSSTSLGLEINLIMICLDDSPHVCWYELLEKNNCTPLSVNEQYFYSLEPKQGKFALKFRLWDNSQRQFIKTAYQLLTQPPQSES